MGQGICQDLDSAGLRSNSPRMGKGWGVGLWGWQTTCLPSTGRRLGNGAKAPESRRTHVARLTNGEFAVEYYRTSRSGGIGRRAAFRAQWPHGRVGSTPTFGIAARIRFGRFLFSPFHPHTADATMGDGERGLRRECPDPTHPDATGAFPDGKRDCGWSRAANKYRTGGNRARR